MADIITSDMSIKEVEEILKKHDIILDGYRRLVMGMVLCQYKKLKIEKHGKKVDFVPIAESEVNNG